MYFALFPQLAMLWETDFDLCLNIGLYDFVLKAEKIKDDLLVLRPVVKTYV